MINELHGLGVLAEDLTWSISTVDGEHETPASNGPQVFHIDGSPVGVFSDLELPDKFSLEQNYPNPFNPTTTIRFGIPEQADVRMVIYDIKGRQIQSIELIEQAPGWYDFIWNGSDTNGQLVSTGLYFCRLQAGANVETIKMVYLK